MKQSDPNHQFIAVAAHLFLAFFIAGGAALYVARQLSGMDQASQWVIALSAAGFIGLLLTWNLQRTLYVLDQVLWRITESLPIKSWPAKNASALEGMVAKVKILAEQERPYHQYRSQQQEQAAEAAAQAVRNRLARDLHDSIKQQLFSIQISTAAVQARWDTDPNAAQNALTDVRQSTQAAMVEMNALLHQLAPHPLEKVGLVQALQEQCEALAYRTDADVQVQIGTLPDEERFLPGTQTTIYRVAQESLSNIARHARAQQITLQLTQNEDQSAIIFTVMDDGLGFKPTRNTAGMGLDNMQQRTTAIGGELNITSKPDHGTTIQASFPLQKTAVYKEQQITQPNHTLNRFAGTALLGGLAAIVALFYPLTRLLPARYVADWPQGTAVLGWICVLFALLIWVGSSRIAVKQIGATNKKQRLSWGAAAGGITGGITYIGLIGAAAAVIGAQRVLQHGPTSTSSEVEFMWLLINDVTGTIWWTYLAFWITAGLAILLGAIGGLWAPTATTKLQDRKTAPALLSEPLFVAAISSLFALIFTYIIYYLLGDQIVDAAVKFLDYNPNSFAFNALWNSEQSTTQWPVLFPPSTPSILPMLSAFAIFNLMMVGLWLALRHEIQANKWQQRWQTMAIALPGSIAWRNDNTPAVINHGGRYR